MQRTLKVFIVDDSYAVVERLEAVLSELGGLELVGHAADAPEAIKSVWQLRPDVVILDLQMPGGSGIGVLEAIKRGMPSVKVIIFTNFPLPQYKSKCFEAGADFFLDKSDFEQIPGIFHELLEAALKTK